MSSQFGEIVSDVESLEREFNEENNLLKEDQEKIEEIKLRLFQMQSDVSKINWYFWLFTTSLLLNILILKFIFSGSPHQRVLDNLGKITDLNCEYSAASIKERTRIGRAIQSACETSNEEARNTELLDFFWTDIRRATNSKLVYE